MRTSPSWETPNCFCRCAEREMEGLPLTADQLIKVKQKRRFWIFSKAGNWPSDAERKFTATNESSLAASTHRPLLRTMARRTLRSRAILPGKLEVYRQPFLNHSFTMPPPVLLTKSREIV